MRHELCGRGTPINKRHRQPDRLHIAGGLFLIVTLLLASPVLADGLDLDVIETDDLRLIYVDPFQTYLVPHVARNFHNSLQFQKITFGWTPHEKSTVILTDFSDYGNAGAGVSPYNGVSVFIAPASRTLETMPSSERMFMLMNHEMVHVANMDVANAQDNRWRRFFAGKPRQTSEHPESILYNYLTVPRLSAPRWYLEGAAVFMETWMSGGLGRAQGAYDEMAFRAADIELEWEGSETDEIGRRTDTGAVVVRVDPAYYRPTEVDLLLGTAEKARRELGWQATTSLADMTREMVEVDTAEARREAAAEGVAR